MTMKQYKQPRPDVNQVVSTMRPASETRPTKPEPPREPDVPDEPDAARSGPAAESGQVRAVKSEYGRPDMDTQGRPSKALFEGGVAAYPDQTPREEAPSTGKGEQYVRLQMRLWGDRLSVVDSHLIDGPLGQVTGFPTGDAYEVTLDGRLLHAGALPDLGVQRSFPVPDGTGVQRGHFVTERDVIEFMARVPARELTPETIGRVRVTLHRVTEETRAPRLGSEPLQRQFERQLRVVAELEGLPESALPEAIDERGGRTPTV
jgi:hypothetical protein